MKEEFDANKFAAEILMPEEYIRNYLEGINNFTLSDVENLAETLHVSIEAIRIRLSSLFLGIY